MFERYTESARRVLFFARYEATQVGGTALETEHLLLGLVREGKTLKGIKQFYLALEPIRAEIERRIPVRERVSTSVEMPFTEETRRVLRFAGEEADRLLHNYIGPQHLLLGLLREERSVAASILTEQGLTIEDVRAQLSKHPWPRTWGGKTNARNGARCVGLPR
jgi:ATP-dependent Clp protease ATP-binding subunit ClpC